MSSTLAYRSKYLFRDWYFPRLPDQRPTTVSIECSTVLSHQKAWPELPVIALNIICILSKFHHTSIVKASITADTRVMASRKQRWSPMFIFIVYFHSTVFFPINTHHTIDIMSSTSYFSEEIKRCDVCYGGDSNLTSQWRYFGKNSLKTPLK